MYRQVPSNICTPRTQVGLAVGTADEDKKNAEFTNIQLQAMLTHTHNHYNVHTHTHTSQVQYILGLENFECIRRRGYLPREQCSEEVRWLWRKWDWLRGIDYQSQKDKMEELGKDTDEKSRVRERERGSR